MKESNVVSLDLYRQKKRDKEFLVWMGGDLTKYRPEDLGYYRARFKEIKERRNYGQ